MAKLDGLQIVVVSLWNNHHVLPPGYEIYLRAIPMDRSHLLGMTTTEQCARPATAADTLPRTNLSKRLLKPVDPTKIQSAPHSSAALTISFFVSLSIRAVVT